MAALRIVTVQRNNNPIADPPVAPTTPIDERDGVLRAILDTAVDAVITMDEAGNIVTFNRGAERIFGYDRREAIGLNIAALMQPNDGAAHAGHVSNYLRTGLARIIGIGREVWGRRRDGAPIALDLAVSEVRIGGRLHFTGVLRDMTDRRSMEKALREERNLLSAILETVGALVVVLDTEGRILRFNRACERATGFVLADVQGRPFWDDLIPWEERAGVEESFRQLTRESSTGTFERHWLTKTGGRRLITWSNATIAGDDGRVTHVIGTGIDITAQRRAEEALVAVSETERRLIGQDLHDILGQQLTGIALLSTALSRSLSREAPAFESDVAGIAELARESVAEAKRLAHGLYPTGLERVGLLSSLADLADTMQRLYRTSCFFEGDSGLPDLDRSVQLHLYRIAQEAANNAVKHGRGENIWIRLEKEDGRVTLSVLDDGSGIPDDIPKGEGMGVEIMKYRARMMNARLAIVRQPDGGTLLTCSVPGVEGARPTTGERTV